MQTIRRWTVTFLIAGVRCYQVLLRPLLAGSCRYVPGCSEYFIEAVKVHGPLRGSWMGLGRIMRCRPGGGWGYDPVPPADGGRHHPADKGHTETKTAGEAP